MDEWMDCWVDDHRMLCGSPLQLSIEIFAFSITLNIIITLAIISIITPSPPSP
jgi:hypothetical protein